MAARSDSTVESDLAATDLQIAIYCDAPKYKVRTYNTEELADDQKKNSFLGIFFLTIPSKVPRR